MSEDVFFSPAQATAKGVDYLSSRERVRSLSRIKNSVNENTYKLGQMYNASAMFPFLGDFADNFLMLCNSDDKGSGRDSIVRVLVASIDSERKSILAKVGGFLGGGSG